MQLNKITTSLAFFVISGFVPVLDCSVNLEAQNVPEGFQQLLPRGEFQAIDNPQYVSAKEARISDRAYVFGVVIEGQPMAYSLNLLNSHEVVNDTIGKTNFAAVW